MNNTIEIKQNEIKAIKATVNKTLDLVNQSINILSDKVDNVNTELILNIITTDLYKGLYESALLNVMDNLGMTKEILVELDYSIQLMYSRMAHNKIKHYRDVKELFKQSDSLVIDIVKKYITIKDNKAVLIDDFENILINDYTLLTENINQDKVIKSLKIIQNEFEKLKEYDINYYNMNQWFYINDNNININSMMLKCIK